MHDRISATYYFDTSVVWTLHQNSEFLFKFPWLMSSLFAFQLLLFTAYASCLLMCSTRCCLHELCISLCLLFCIITVHVGDCSCKTLMFNRDFWYARSSKRQNGRKTLVSLWWLDGCACFYSSLIISLCFCYSHSLYLDFPCIGLSLLNFFNAV